MIQFLKTLIISLIIINIASCTVKTRKHGYVFEESSIKKLQKGKTDKSEVLDIMGTPSTISDFDKNIWYYIGNQTKQISMLKPKSISDRVLQISFKNNKINEMKTYESSDIKALKFSNDKTEILGDDTGMLKDFVQNLGRFNKAKRKRA